MGALPIFLSVMAEMHSHSSAVIGWRELLARPLAI
jgi:hypothetical protein